MADNCRVHLGNQQNEWLDAPTKRFNKLGLSTRFKGRGIDLIDRRSVVLFFGPNEHRSRVRQHAHDPSYTKH